MAAVVLGLGLLFYFYTTSKTTDFEKPVNKSESVEATLVADDTVVETLSGAEPADELDTIEDDITMDSGRTVNSETDPGEVFTTKNGQTLSSSTQNKSFDSEGYDLGFTLLPDGSVPQNLADKFSNAEAEQTKFFRLEKSNAQDIFSNSTADSPLQIGLESVQVLSVVETYSTTSVDEQGRQTSAWHGEVENWPCAVMNVALNGEGNMQLLRTTIGK
ncbi:MAG: hypothetical protein AB8G18_19120 [Gammaproteobacteria bacterium]